MSEVSSEVTRILGLLENVKRSSDRQWKARCPAHNDTNPSLSIGIGDDARPLLHCHAGCSFDEILAALNAPTQATGAKVIPITSAKRRRAQSLRRLTVKMLAEAKCLPDESLADWGVRNDPWVGVLISYRDFEGRLLATKTRTALRAREGTYWPRGVPLATYGDWRLRQDLKRTRGKLYIAEGESDTWTLWFHGLAAIGIPGANNWKLITQEHLVGVRGIVIMRDADAAGDAFVINTYRWLRDQLGFDKSKIERSVLPAGIKDVSELHIRSCEEQSRRKA